MSEVKQPPNASDIQPKIDPIHGAFVLAAGFSTTFPEAAIVEAVTGAGNPRPSIEQKRNLAQTRSFLIEQPVGVLVLGPAIDSQRALDLLEEIAQNYSHIQPATILIGDYDPGALQTLVQDDRLFFSSRQDLIEDDLVRVVAAAIAHYRDHLMLNLAVIGRSRDPRVVADRVLLETVESLRLATDLEALEDPLLEGLEALVGFDAGRLWIYDSVHQVLKAPAAPGEEVSATVGITSFVARTGVAVCCEHAAQDPRFDLDADEQAEARLLVVPILSGETVLGTLALRRGLDELEFSAQDKRLTGRLVQQLAPTIARKVPNAYATIQQQHSQTVGHLDIFRPEALQAQEHDFTDTGRLLRNGPGWARWTWAALWTGFLAALLFTLLISMHDYASGPAVVRVAPSSSPAVAKVASQPQSQTRSVVGLLPGHFSPQIAPGQSLRLTLTGYPDLPLDLSVGSIGREIISQRQARQSLGDLIVDAVTFDGAVVRVEGQLPAAFFDDGHKQLKFRDGMQGVMEIRVRSRPILFHLIPGLDRVFH